jgi:surfeit locus 1 family protein
MTGWLSASRLGLTALALVLVAAMAWLGWWQLGVYDDRQYDDAEAVQQRQPVPLDDVLGPDDAFPADRVGQPVIATGHYVADDQFYARGLEGAADTYAVVTPLLTGSGSAILVVRGSAAVSQVPVPDGDVRVEGVIEPSMNQGSGPDASRLTDGIRIPSLVSSLDDDLYSGYVILRDSTPDDSLRVVVPPLGDASRWAGLRNLLYAIQWWVFAGFVVLMWWRILREQQSGEERPG